MARFTGKHHRISGLAAGEITGERITVGRRGIVRGKLGGEHVVIHGSVEGTVKAQTILLGRTAHVSGELLYDSLTVQPGAQIEARCVPSEAAEPANEAPLPLAG